MSRVTTKSGDDGYTSLLGGGRVPKYDDRVEAIGALDEATSAMGLARALAVRARTRALVESTQRDLYRLMGELATPRGTEPLGQPIADDDVARLEAEQAAIQRDVAIGNAFIIPGATPAGAALDVARAVVRRAERRAARLLHNGTAGGPAGLRYLNRLSDLLFVLARDEEAAAGVAAPKARRD